MNLKTSRDPTAETFRKRFRQLRGDRTMGQFASDVGLVRQTISTYEMGTRIPGSIDLAKICAACNCSADWLLGLSDAKTPTKDIQGACHTTGLSEPALNAVSEATNTIYNDLPIRGALNELLCSPLLKQILYWFSKYKLSCYHLSSLTEKHDAPQEHSVAIARHDEKQKKDVAALHLQRLLFKLLENVERQGDTKWQA